MQTKNPWVGSSECLEYTNTHGKKLKVTRLSAAWEMLQNPPERSSIFKELQPGEKPVEDQNHVIVHSSAKISDVDVPALAAAAGNWNALSQVPGMSSEMVLLADLQSKTEYFIVKDLNKKLEAEGFGRVDFVSNAVYRLRNKGYSQEYRDELRTLLEGFFSALMDSVEKGKAVVQEWPTVMEWRQQRCAFAHPLGDPIDKQKLACLKDNVSNSDAFKDVRSTASLLVKVAESLPVQ